MIQVKKSDLIIAVSILAAVIIGLFAVFVSCQDLTSYTVEEAPPVDPGPQLPVASILNAEKASTGNAQFNLEWTPAEGKTEAEIFEAVKDVRQKWKEYEVYMDALPYVPAPEIEEGKVYDVWEFVDGTRKLNNYSSEAMPVIQRYWESAWGAQFTVPSWLEKRPQREQAFFAAKAKIEAQMADLQASDFWNVSGMEGSDEKFPLKETQQSMQAFISTGTIPAAQLYTDRDGGEGDWKDDKTTEMTTGHLYALFFGPIPKESDYYNTGDGAIYVYPVE
jgi:hypothetical protein